MSENTGPMGLANQQIREAFDEFAAGRLAGRRLPIEVREPFGAVFSVEHLLWESATKQPYPLSSPAGSKRRSR